MGGETAVLSKELGEANTGSLHSASSERITDSVCGISQTGINPLSISVVRQRELPCETRDISNDRQRGNHRSDPSDKSICESVILGPQERRDAETSDQLEKVEHVCAISAFQDGGPPSIERPDTAKRLDVENRPQGRLFQCPSGGQTPAISEVCLGGETVPVPMHAIWTGSSPSHIYQVNETGNCISQTTGNKTDNLFGRYDSVESRQVGIREGSQLPSILANAIRVCDQLEEIAPDSDPDLRFLGFYNRLNDYVDVSPRGQDLKDCPKVSETYRGQNCEGETPRGDGGTVNSLSQGSFTCPPPLQAPSNDPDQGVIDRPIIRGLGSLTTRSSDRVEVVDRKHRELEREDYNLPLPRSVDRHRRVSPRLGGGHGELQNRGGMDPRGKTPPHKCVGVESCFLCSQVVCNRPPKDSCPSEDGQCFSSHLHPKDGRDSISAPFTRGSRPLGLLSPERDYSISRISPRVPEFKSGLGIEEYLGHERLEARPLALYDVKQDMGAPRDRSLRQPSQCSIGEIRELASGPLCSVSGRVSAALGRATGLSIPPLLLDTPLPSEGVQGQGHGDYYNTNMAVTAMVPDTIGDVGDSANSSPTVSKTASLPEKRTSSPVRPGGASISGVESVRRQALSRGVSVDAANLLAEHSWRRGTRGTYESAWRQWSRWCLQEQADPLCSPVESVVNYLTDRYNKGDQYNTLNIHRSAISAFHNPINNIKVGQHPSVIAIMSACFNARPPMPRYERTWDVDIILNHLKSRGDNKRLALKQLTLKLTMLLALTCAGRSSDLHALDIRYMKLEDDKVSFNLAKLTKARRKGKPPLKIEINKFEDNANLCVLSVLRTYLDRTSGFRERKDGCVRSQLLLSFVEPHKPVVSCTIAGWLLKQMAEAGVDTEEFKAHSTRGAATSRAAAKGLSCKEIMSMAKWKKKATFYKHYCREIIDQVDSKEQKFESVVLSQ